MEEEIAYFNAMFEDLKRQIGLVADAQVLANERLDRLENKVDRAGEQFVHLETRFDVMEKRFDGMEKRFDGMEKRFDGMETRLTDLGTEVSRRLERIETHLELNGSVARPRSTKRLPPKPRKKS